MMKATGLELCQPCQQTGKSELSDLAGVHCSQVRGARNVSQRMKSIQSDINPMSSLDFHPDCFVVFVGCLFFLHLINSWDRATSFAGMLVVDMSHCIIASSEWQFVATLSVGTRAGGAIVHGAAGGKTVRESMPGEVPRSSCLVLTN
jgi:hypothetical protein